MERLNRVINVSFSTCVIGLVQCSAYRHGCGSIQAGLGGNAIRIPRFPLRLSNPDDLARGSHYGNFDHFQSIGESRRRIIITLFSLGVMPTSLYVLDHSGSLLPQRSKQHGRRSESVQGDDNFSLFGVWVAKEQKAT